MMEYQTGNNMEYEMGNGIVQGLYRDNCVHSSDGSGHTMPTYPPVFLFPRAE